MSSKSTLIMIRLVSPNIKSDDFVFYWQQNAKVANEENKYIVNTIHWVIEDVEEMKVDKELLSCFHKVDIKSYSSVKELSELFNKKLVIIKDEWSKTKTQPAFLNRRPSKRHLHHIIDYCYSRAVEDPDKLNQYVPFSAEVYGETSFELVDQIIEWVNFRKDDIFIDLGSGVGQVVLQVAAATDCRSCAGIEKSEYPAKCAQTLDTEFRRTMNYFGKPFNPFALTRGDFLADEFQEMISGASVIFANNFAFGPMVDHQLKNRFTSLKEGAKIISSKAFCPLKFRITDRNLDDIGSIMRVTSLSAMKDAVSWTCSAFSYFLHQVDHSMLEEYFAKYKQRPKEKDGSEVEPKSVTNGSLSIVSGAAGRRASERLLRNCRKWEKQQPQSIVTVVQKKRIHPDRRTRAERQKRRQQPDQKPVVVSKHARLEKDREQDDKEDVENRQQLRQLHEATVARVGSAEGSRLASANGGPDMVRFAGASVGVSGAAGVAAGCRGFSDLTEALAFAADTKEDPALCHSEDVVPLAVHQYLELVRHGIMRQLASMQTSQYRTRVLAEIGEQRRLRDRLAGSVHELETGQIPRLLREGVSLLGQHMALLGIHAHSATEFFSAARRLIREQAAVETRNSRVRAEIAELLANQRRLKDRIKERVELAVPVQPPLLLPQLLSNGHAGPPVYSPISRGSSSSYSPHCDF